MKKVFFAVFFTLVLTTFVAAQVDTIIIDPFDNNRYVIDYEEVLDTSLIHNTSCNINNIYVERRHTDTQLVVFGIAIAIIGPDLIQQPLRYIDSSTDNWIEHTRLYKPEIDGTMTLLGEGGYNVFMPAQYYLPPKPVGTPQIGIETLRLPLYETYFNDVAVVTDSFYIGTTGHNNVSDGHGTTYSYNSSMAAFFFIDDHSRRDTTVDVTTIPYAMWRCSYDGTSWRWMSYRFTLEYYIRQVQYSWETAICYPILTPDPNRDTIANPYHYPWDTVSTDTTHVDTTQVDTTHSGISAGVLERYINVYPTVTDGGAVTVLSSFHLEGVEVYDAAGRMLSRQPASGVATTVDVSQLPAGSYVLRINTVSGSTTKKFLKR